MGIEGNNKCQLLGTFGIIVQMLLGFITFMVLIGTFNGKEYFFLVKRQLEKPRRLWKIFLMDTGKQLISALLTHFLNVGLAVLLSSTASDDACIWYFITYICDTTIGVGISYLLLLIFEKLFDRRGQNQFKSGNYYKIIFPSITTYGISSTQTSQIKKTKPKVEVDYAAYVFQLILWNFIVLIVTSFRNCLQSKTILYFFQLLLASVLENIADFIFYPVRDNPNLELTIIMVVIPLVMNALMFWIQDNFLKKNEIKLNEKDLVMGVLYEQGSDVNLPGVIEQKEVEMKNFDAQTNDKNSQEPNEHNNIVLNQVGNVE